MLNDIDSNNNNGDNDNNTDSDNDNDNDRCTLYNNLIMYKNFNAMSFLNN